MSPQPHPLLQPVGGGEAGPLVPQTLTGMKDAIGMPALVGQASAVG